MLLTFPIPNAVPKSPFVSCTDAGKASVRTADTMHTHHAMTATTMAHHVASTAELPAI